MGVMRNVDLVQGLVGRWDPSEIAFIRELRFDGEDDRLELVVLLQPRTTGVPGWPDPKGTFWAVSMLFEGIRDLELSHCQTGDLQVEGLEISDHSDSQMEDVRLQVTGRDMGALSFWARSGVILGCERVATSVTAYPLGRRY